MEWLKLHMHMHMHIRQTHRIAEKHYVNRYVVPVWSSNVLAGQLAFAPTCQCTRSLYGGLSVSRYLLMICNRHSLSLWYFLLFTCLCVMHLLQVLEYL